MWGDMDQCEAVWKRLLGAAPGLSQSFTACNHLHFQAYYLDLPLACELAATSPLILLPAVAGAVGWDSLSAPPMCKRRRGGGAGPSVRVSRLSSAYPVNGFVIEVDASVAVRGSDGNAAVAGPADCVLAALASVVGGACERMQRANVPHNLLVADCGRRVFLWPQCFAERQAAGQLPEVVVETGINPAVFEIAGHLLLKRREDYEGGPGGEEAAAVELLRHASLPEERFMAVARMCFGAGGECGN